MSDTTGSEYPGWEADAFETLTLTVVITGEHMRLATVTFDAEAGLYTTYIGAPVTGHQLGLVNDCQFGDFRRHQRSFLALDRWQFVMADDRPDAGGAKKLVPAYGMKRLLLSTKGHAPLHRRSLLPL